LDIPTEKEQVLFIGPADAVTVTRVWDGAMPAVIGTTVEFSPAGMVTFSGTISSLGLELESKTVTPPAGAGRLSKTSASTSVLPTTPETLT
jgi:hypothetical protein